MDLQTGDVILTSKDSIVVWFMNLFQKDPCFWGHVLVAKDSEDAWEANWTLRESNIERVLKKHKYYKIMRKKDLTEGQREDMRETAPELLGHPYGVGRIFLQSLDHIFHTNWFTRLDDREYVQVCSSYGAWIYKMTCDYEFNGEPWQSCDPDDIEDDQLNRPENWQVIGEKGIRRK
jgi:hypothetical protein